MFVWMYTTPRRTYDRLSFCCTTYWIEIIHLIALGQCDEWPICLAAGHAYIFVFNWQPATFETCWCLLALYSNPLEMITDQIAASTATHQTPAFAKSLYKKNNSISGKRIDVRNFILSPIHQYFYLSFEAQYVWSRPCVRNVLYAPSSIN